MVSAFAQAGILFTTPEGQSPFAEEQWVSYVDPSQARALVRKTGLFGGGIPFSVTGGSGSRSKPCGFNEKGSQNSNCEWMMRPGMNMFLDR